MAHSVKEMRKQYPIGSEWSYRENFTVRVKVLNIYRKGEIIYFKLLALHDASIWAKKDEIFKVSFHIDTGMGGYCPWCLL